MEIDSNLLVRCDTAITWPRRETITGAAEHCEPTQLPSKNSLET